MNASSGGGQPWLNVTPTVGLRVSASIMLISMGMYYLSAGRKEASLDKMIAGALLCLLSMMTFAL